MGLKRGYSAGADLVDVAAVLAAFEAINSVRLSIRLGLVKEEKRDTLYATLEAFEGVEESGEVKVLASARLRLGFPSPQTMEAAILQGLYKLDADLAAGEFARTKVK